MTVPLFKIPAAIQQAFKDGFDTMLRTDVFGQECRLYYPPTQTRCTNCRPDVAGKKSSNIWINGGPIPFPAQSVCPVCNGYYLRSDQATEVVTMTCNFNPTPYYLSQVLGPENSLDLRIPNGYALTRGTLTDLPKVKRCQSAVLGLSTEGYSRFRYVLAGEPLDTYSIVQGRYFLCVWKRTGG